MATTSDTAGAIKEIKSPAVNDEIPGRIYRPVFFRQLTLQKHVYLASRVVDGMMTPNSAIQQLNRYRRPSDCGSSNLQQSLQRLSK